MRQLPQNVSNEDTISDWSLSSKMAKIPTLERLYECGEVLANAKGLTHKVLTFTLKFGVWTHFRALDLLYVPTGSQGGVWGDPTWCSRRWSVQEAQFAVHWKVGLHFYHSPKITCFWKTAPERWDDLFFSIQVLPPLPRPLPAVDRRNARPVRGRQHHDQDAGVIIFISLLFL